MLDPRFRGGDIQIASPSQLLGTGRPSGRPPLEQPASSFGLLAMTCFFISVIFFSGPIFSEEIPERIDGAVANVDADHRLLRIDFEHPATFERSQLEFQVAAEASFKDFKKLSDLKPGDLVSLDYLDYGTFLKAVYVIHIPQKKIYFTHQEIAGALVKIKSNHNHEKEPEKN